MGRRLSIGVILCFELWSFRDAVNSVAATLLEPRIVEKSRPPAQWIVPPSYKDLDY